MVELLKNFSTLTNSGCKKLAMTNFLANRGATGFDE
jgi:hypothetical protein